MKAQRAPLVLVVLLAALVFMVSGCGERGSSGSREEQNAGQAGSGKPGDVTHTIFINGAGASFPYPLYSHWINEYCNSVSNVKINYQSIGSGAGIEQVSKKIIDFGGSDAPMSDEKMSEAPGEILHIPTVLGAVAVIYNLPDVGENIKFTPEILADIFLGKITKWNDLSLVAVNNGVNLPDREIVVVRRSDGSGTTNIFTDYLSTISVDWKEKVGQGTSVQWPTGLGAKGSEGVSRQVQATAGSIGYVEVTYALMNKLQYGLIQNRSGKYVAPTIDSITAAAAGAAPDMPEDLRVSIVNPPGESAYPIAGYTYILVYREQDDPVKGRALARFLWWAVHDGEKMAAELSYAPLPPEVVGKVEKKLRSMTSGGHSLL